MGKIFCHTSLIVPLSNRSHTTSNHRLMYQVYNHLELYEEHPSRADLYHSSILLTVEHNFIKIPCTQPEE
ncbi:hypothetical protein HYC85_025640 [Camellia sinensis]|uniref:Uncharacterized protein n=1 Tax=Camellia sinensis TaxID=4442 RepID=A0A7J7GFG2_CAMSI|nr:hypothetical protein HYC85_025640 [Camellia sinensis]